MTRCQTPTLARTGGGGVPGGIDKCITHLLSPYRLRQKKNTKKKKVASLVGGEWVKNGRNKEVIIFMMDCEMYMYREVHVDKKRVIHTSLWLTSSNRSTPA